MSGLPSQHDCDVEGCPCWFPREYRGPAKVCGGSVEVWDQTIGCPECGWQLWEWTMWAGDVCMDEACRLFDEAHPLQFNDGHDPGDEDRPDDWVSPDPPYGGWRLPSHAPAWHAVEVDDAP